MTVRPAAHKRLGNQEVMKKPPRIYKPSLAADKGPQPKVSPVNDTPVNFGEGPREGRSAPAIRRNGSNSLTFLARQFHSERFMHQPRNATGTTPTQEASAMPYFDRWRTMSEMKVPHLMRLVQLRRAGLSNAAVSIVLNLDYGLHTNAEQVRGYGRRFGARFPVAKAHVSHDNGNLKPFGEGLS